jgi:tetratricopeptide (TPR) repeat protein
MHNDWFCWIVVLLLVSAVGGGEEPGARFKTADGDSPAGMKKGAIPEPDGPGAADKSGQNKFAGSKSCGDCHEQFNKLWSTYWHGMSMRPYSDRFAKDQLSPQQADVVIGDKRYRAEIGDAQGWVLEQGRQGVQKYPILHVIGGKNVFYFLTSLERGRLQVLPLAYDVNRQAWYDTTASAVVHLNEPGALTPVPSPKGRGAKANVTPGYPLGASPGADRRLVGREDNEALLWTDRLYTFNTACFNCHVSRLATNYDLESDTYSTTWGEPGISCETCHGPSGEHNRLMQAGIKGRSAEEMKIIINKDFAHDQLTDLCVTCHAKIIPLSADFSPGEKFFDHYDLVTLEHADYYADGRDLGENYSYTSWLMAPCLKSGKLDCKYCHTPAGRFKFTEYQGYQTCMPCHEKYVRHPEEHGHHQTGSKGNECVGCHMPKTLFAGRARTDHSMRAPSPSASMVYNSPNACNICHADHDFQWSDEWVRKWYPRDYQAEVLRRAGLIEAARRNQWDRLPEMLEEIGRSDNDQVYRNSLVRLVRQCNDPRKWAAMLRAVKDPSPLVRSSAAFALGGRTDRESLESLFACAGDKARIVRIRAAMALAAVPPEKIEDPARRKVLENAVGEFKTAMKARADDWASYANLGDFYLERGDFAEAVKNYENALRLEPRMIEVLMNQSVAYSNMRQNDRAEKCLRRALETAPDNAAANFDLGLLLAEEGNTDEAEKALRKAIKSDARSAAANYNLGVMLADRNNMSEAIALCRKACQLQPDDAKYARALALYLYREGDAEGAIEVLRRALDNKDLAPQERQELEGKMRSLQIAEPDKKSR